MNGLLSGLWAASASASVMIVTALLLRALFQNRTPRRLFCLVWDAVLARLLLPAALPSPWSVWQWLPAARPAAPALQTAAPDPTAFSEAATWTGAAEAAARSPAPQPSGEAVLAAVWLAAALALAGWFVCGYGRAQRRYADALPCADAFAQDWLARHALRRRVRLRTSDRVAAPLTYGVLRPVILLPAAMDLANHTALSCVLKHEHQHIRRFDTLRKALLAAALCLHWWNPLVWTMAALCGRDIELACDEAVTAQGADRADYARTLLAMEEQRGQWVRFGSHFSQNALQERIRSIMKQKHCSALALLAVLALMGASTTVFAASAPERGRSGTDTDAGASFSEPWQATEGGVIILSQGGEDGERLYSVDGGETWLREEEYRAQYGGGDWQVEWWTAEEYAAWLEEEKQALQDLIGERGYTGSEGWFTWDQARVDKAVALYEGILEDIQNGALYSKTITDADGVVVEDVSLGSGTQGAAEAFAAVEEDAAAPMPEDAAALLDALRAFGVERDAGKLTYHGKRIRCLADGASVGTDGYAFWYCYTDPNGVVDVHTLRAVRRNPDGSENPMGALLGVAAEGEPGFDAKLIESAGASGGLEAFAEQGAEALDPKTAEALERYRPFGLQYEFTRSGMAMHWKGQPVHSLYDTETQTWFANNLHGSELGDDAVDLETVYRGKTLTGLRESQTPRPEPDEAFGLIAETAGSGVEERDADAAAIGEVIRALDADAEATGAAGNTADGHTLAEHFAAYRPYGLLYTEQAAGLGRLTYQGKAVLSFTDQKPDGGVFSYRSPDASEGLSVYTVYNASGELFGLRAA